MPTKMVISVDVDTGTVDWAIKVPVGGGAPANIPAGAPPSPPVGGFRHVGTLLAYAGSNCLTLNIPGGGSYTVCA